MNIVKRLQVTGYRLQNIIISFLFFFLLSTVHCTLSPTFAADEFSTSYDVSYDVGADGVTNVTEKVTLKNLTSQYYATQFSLTIGATQITDVSASDPSGPLEVTKEQKGTSTTINVKFNQQVAGIGKELPWTLSFKSEDFASAQGKIWEVTLPKIVSTSNLENYNVTLSVPTIFGPPTSISPNPKKQTSSFDRLFLTFDKEQLAESGVSANFGDKQLFDFDLTYHLENPNLVPGVTNISLPPDTAYQDVFFTRIEPKPVNITVDDDGNYLAWYKLNRNEKLDIKVTGSAKLYIKSKVKSPKLDPTLQQKYLKQDKYWDKDHPAIKTRLSEILGSITNISNFEKARLIHRHISNNLKYNATRLADSKIERLGAITALANPEAAVCMEFTDLFIALARAAGIPARELNGYAYTANPALRPLSLTQDVLHAWPEFYDEQRGWIMIDPTWENTTGGVDYFNKFDLNHFVFVTKGLSSEAPAPAGAYKYDGQDSQDVKVNFSSEDFLGKPQLEVLFGVPDPVIAGFPGKIKIKLSNLGNALQQTSVLEVNAGKLTILDESISSTGPIPAFGHAEFEINTRTKSLIENYDDVIEVTVAGQKFRKDIHIR
ncbi:MAG: Transglutaminase protein, partial [Microgenomates group bacterium Gr01-1014_80]